MILIYLALALFACLMALMGYCILRAARFNSDY